MDGSRQPRWRKRVHRRDISGLEEDTWKSWMTAVPATGFHSMACPTVSSEELELEQHRCPALGGIGCERQRRRRAWKCWLVTAQAWGTGVTWP